MSEANSTAKSRYFKRIHDSADVIACACGCGEQIKDRDLYARPRRFVSGHNTRKYPDKSQHKREWNHRNRKRRYAIKAASFRRKKIMLIRLKGGQCADCALKHDGNNACVFHLHHRDPSQKLFAIGNQLCNKAWAIILAEAAKCDLLCANCHEMRHGGGF